MVSLQLVIRINKKRIAQYFACFCAASFCGAYWFELYKLPLLTVTCLIGFWIFLNSRGIRLRAPIVACTLMLVAFMLVRMLTSDGIGITDWLTVSGQILIAYLAFEVDRDKAPRMFINVCAVLCAVSLVFYCIQSFNPGILTRLLSPTQYGNRVLYGKWFYVFRPYNLMVEANRNNGIFTEPGRFQVVITAALFILFFFRDRVNYSSKGYIWLIMLFAATMVTTGSTTGYFSLAILVAFFLLHQETRQKNLKRRIFAVIAVLLAVLLYEYSVMGSNSILGMYVFDKLADTDITDQYSSGGARLRMLNIVLNAIIKHPLGAGQDYITGLMDVVNTAGAGLFRFIAAIGAIPSVAMLIWFSRPFFKRKYWFIGICFVLLYLNTGSAQTYAVYSPYLLCSAAMVYGSRDNREKIPRTVTIGKQNLAGIR